MAECVDIVPDTDQLNILELNDDCLLNIFRYLNSHQLAASLGTCRKFDEIIHIILRRCKELRINFRFFNVNDEKLLWLVSPHLISIELFVGYSISTDIVVRALKPIAQCKQLQKFSFHYVKMCEEYLKYIRCFSDKLDTIDFSYSELTDELMNDFFRLHCSSLRHIVLFGNYTFVGCSLAYLRNLKTLVIESHDHFNLDLREFNMNNPKTDIVYYEKGRIRMCDE